MMIDLDGGATPAKTKPAQKPKAASKSQKRRSVRDAPNPELDLPKIEPMPDVAQTEPDALCGPGGRVVVADYAGGSHRLRAPKAGDEKRPRCKACSTPDMAVLAVEIPKRRASASIRFGCPTCNWTIELLDAKIAQAFVDKSIYKRPPETEPIVLRPFGGRGR